MQRINTEQGSTPLHVNLLPDSKLEKPHGGLEAILIWIASFEYYSSMSRHTEINGTFTTHCFSR